MSHGFGYAKTATGLIPQPLTEQPAIGSDETNNQRQGKSGRRFSGNTGN